MLNRNGPEIEAALDELIEAHEEPLFTKRACKVAHWTRRLQALAEDPEDEPDMEKAA